MPRPRKGDDRMNYQTVVRLPDEWGQELQRIARETSVPPAVLARQWLVERLRHLREDRLRREREGQSAEGGATDGR